MNAKNFCGDSPLKYAIEQNHIKLVKYLIENGADTNAVNSKKSPINYAIELESEDLLELLINKSAIIKTKLLK